MLLPKIRAYLELARYLLCISTFFMTILGYWLAIHKFDFSNADVYLAAIAVTAALAFANILNDILDVKVDQINFPNRPIPSGVVTVTEVGWLAAFVCVISLLFGFLVGWRMFLFVIFLLAFAALYDIWAVKVPILGKVIVAVWSALTLATGYIITDKGTLPLIPMLVALFFILAREFVETISDAAGDEVGGRRSIYTLWGRTRVLQICFVLIITSVVALFIPLFTAELTSHTMYLLTITFLLILPVSLAMLAIWRDQSNTNIRNVAHWVGIVYFSSFVAFLWLV